MRVDRYGDEGSEGWGVHRVYAMVERGEDGERGGGEVAEQRALGREWRGVGSG